VPSEWDETDEFLATETGGGGRRRSTAPADRDVRLRFRDWRFRVRDILAAVEAIAAYTEGMDYDAFVADRRTVDAVVRNLATMGESVRWIPDPIQDRWPDVPWQGLRGVRNVVVHEYFGVDERILWQTVIGDLPPLVAKLESVLAA
jgi:uncharacterized protein with HEPN domain